jgi:PAS domain S-box-containing protein
LEKTSGSDNPINGTGGHQEMREWMDNEMQTALLKKFSESFKGYWRWSFAAALISIIGIIGYLLWYNYATQRRLQYAAIARFAEELNGRAKAADYFIQERANDVRELANSNVVTAYFTNKSLGMSEAYGLKGSLVLIHKQFRYLNKSMTGEEKIFTRLSLFSPSGVPLVEYQSESPSPVKRWEWNSIKDVSGRQPVERYDALNPSYLLFAVPVRISGQIEGYVAGWVSLKVIHNKYIAYDQPTAVHASGDITSTILSTDGHRWYATPEIDNRLMQSLCRKLSAIFPPTDLLLEKMKDTLPPLSVTDKLPETRFTLTGLSGQENNLFVAATRLSLKNITLISIINQSHLADPAGPLRLLLMLALFSATVVGLAMITVRHGAKVQDLAGMLADSQRQQDEIRRINEQLNMEIDQRKVAESQINREKNLLRNLITAIPDIIYYKNADSVYMGCNPAFEMFCGMEEKEITGKRTRDLFNQNMAITFVEQDKKVIEKGEVLLFEQWVDLPDGRQILLETKKTPYYSEAGRMIGLIGISRDITERKRTEMKLNEQRDRLELVIRATNTGIWEWNVETGETIFNERWAGIIGYTLAELSPLSIRTWTDLCHPDDLERSNRALEQHFKKKTDFYECECRMKHKQGHWVWVYDCGRVVEWTPHNKPFRMLGTHSDITQRKQHEEAIRQANETLERRIDERTREIEKLHGQMVMQEKMASVGQLAAGIAHELNNPINFVRTNFATLTENFTDLSEVIKDYREFTNTTEFNNTSERIAAIHAKEKTLQVDFLLNDIPLIFLESERGFERIARIVQSMRDFSYVNHSGNMTYFNINKGITDTLVISKNIYKYHADVHTDLGDVPDILCLPEQINQVLLNLVVNSAQAIEGKPDGGSGLITIRTFYERGFVCCQVADNGPGIPIEIRSRIFEPFFTTKAPGKGTGLGLSISYDIVVHKHKGILTVDCPETGGTVFTLRLPVKEQPKEVFFEDR